MTLWNINKLVSKLQARTLSEFEVFQYFMLPLLFVIIFGLFAMITNLILIEVTIFDFITSLIIFIGTTICYSRNKGNDNQDFVVRITCLSVVLGVRFFVIIFSVFIVLLPIGIFFIGSFNFLNDLLSDVIFSVLTMFFYSVFYWRLHRYIHFVSNSNTILDAHFE